MNTHTEVGGIDIEALASQIAMRMDAENVGAYLKCSARYVQEEYVKAPGFPKAIHLIGPDGRRGNARWRRQGWPPPQGGDNISTLSPSNPNQTKEN